VRRLTGNQLPSSHTGRKPVPTLEEVSVRSAHVPDDGVMSVVVLRHQIRRAVAVEVTRTDYAPARGTSRCKQRSLPGEQSSPGLSWSVVLHDAWPLTLS
jgi:hypothetical protein